MAAKKSKTKEEAVKSISKDEAEKLVMDLAKKDVPLSKIGLTLRKEHGIGRAKLELGKIGKILKKNKVKRFPDDLKSLIEKAKNLRKHRTKNYKDNVSKRGLQITEAKIRNLAAYFKKSKVIEQNWEYIPELK